MPDRLATVIDVLEYGADPTGSADSGPAIQSAFDAAYGPASSPNSQSYQNKGVHLPAGNYKTNQQLVLAAGGPDGHGVFFFGDGQRNTRIFYNGPLSSSPLTTFVGGISGNVLTVTSGLIRAGWVIGGPGITQCRIVSQLTAAGGVNDYGGAGTYGVDVSQTVAPGTTFNAYVTPLLTVGNSTVASQYGVISGINFDCTGSLSCGAVQLGAGPSGGSGVTWFDCGFTGATNFGWLSSNGSLGSEQILIDCNWTNCGPSGGSGIIPIDGGMVIASDNALDITVIGGSFNNCSKGIVCPLGVVNLMQGINFNNNAQIDIWVKEQNVPAIIGCNSNSPVFTCCALSTIIGCRHNPASLGLFIDWSNTTSRFLLDLATVVAEGNYVSNGRIAAPNNSCNLYLRGNNFERSDYISALASLAVVKQDE
jgi:hypothetical protein